MEPEIKKNDGTTSGPINPPTPTPTPTVAVEPEKIAEPTVVTPKIETETETKTETETTTTVTSALTVRKNLPIKQYLIALVIILIIGALLWVGLERQGRVNTQVLEKAQSLLGVTPSAAIVNGQKISMADYEKNRQQIILSAGQQGLDVNEPSIQSEINTQAIDVLVNTELLRQSAKEAGVTVTPEQIETRYQEVVTSVGGAEELAKKMTELNLTEASLRNDIEGEILIQSHLTKAVDISKVEIKPEEIKAVYDQAAGTQKDLPPLEEVKTEIESQLRFAKEQELTKDFIETLRAKADIKILI